MVPVYPVAATKGPSPLCPTRVHGSAVLVTSLGTLSVLGEVDLQHHPICVSVTDKGAERLSCVACVFAFEKCLFRPLTHIFFLIGLFDVVNFSVPCAVWILALLGESELG